MRGTRERQIMLRGVTAGALAALRCDVRGRRLRSFGGRVLAAVGPRVRCWATRRPDACEGLCHPVRDLDRFGDIHDISLMRVLRLGTSNDSATSIPDEGRGWRLAERMLAESAGVPVETILKRAWPNASLPGLVDRWLDEFQPDLVVLQVNNFWYGYESVPLWLERRLGRAGKGISTVGLRVGKSPRFAESRWAQLANRRLLRVLPGATYFTVPDVAAGMEAAMRKVLAREGIVLIVRGNEHWPEFPMATRRFNRRNARRNAAMSAAMRATCERMRVPYYERPTVAKQELRFLLSDGAWHNNEAGERLQGEFDGRAMAEAWSVIQSNAHSH